MFDDLSQFVDLGGTVIVAGMALYCIVQIIKSKRNHFNGNSKEILKELQLINNNHLNTICKKVEDGTKELINTIHTDNIKIIELLGRIDGKLK